MNRRSCGPSRTAMPSLLLAMLLMTGCGDGSDGALAAQAQTPWPTPTSTATPVAARNWIRSWAAAPQAQAPGDKCVPDLTDRTVRQIVRSSAKGEALRLRLTNEATPAQMRVGAVHVALVGLDGAIVPGSDRSVTFGGAGTATLAPGTALSSDEVPLRLAPLDRLAISIYLPQGAPSATYHRLALATSQIAGGDETGAPTLRDPSPLQCRVLLSGVDVESATPRSTIIALGDSITDGMGSTPDADHRWPDFLAERLREANLDEAVADEGIGGNRLLLDGVGSAGLTRFARDALAVPGVATVIILEGINDIGDASTQGTPVPDAGTLIDAYRQMIARAHGAGVKVILGTLLPYKGAAYWTPEGESVREAVNSWIRSGGEADAIVDFDPVVADPSDPLRQRPELNSGDALHPNDAGYRAMANAIDLGRLH